MKFFKLVSVLLFLSLFACDYFDDSQSEEGKKIVTNQQIRESHSYANIEEVYTKHLHLDMEVDFDNNSIYGVARHTMINKGSDTAVFDIKGLEIQKVTLGEKDHEVNTNFVIGIEDSILGAPLSVKIDRKSTLINIYYKTTEGSEALDWLKPEMTKGKKFPYLYTQGQAILTRTWIPSQDRPSNRITYSADVKVPEGMMALMSAKNPTKKSKDGLYHFEMNQPIPVYLIALAVGNLEYRKIGKNCGVYSEPEMIRQVAWEFKDLRKMIVAAEGIYGKYQWEQYDVIVLPYSFPFGGMENPRLTFANPTLLAGDRSLISVIAHELAHSWSGNLVTNATWDDFWLNEGFTVYFENRIMESLYGKDIADILALIEFQELKAEVKEISDGDHPEDTYLKLSLDGRNPDDGMTSVAYVKGAFFLKTLEEKVGREKFDVFVKGYFKKFQFKTLTTEIFEKYLEDNLLKPNKIKFNTKAWLYGKGIPKNCIKIVSPRFVAMQKMADDFNEGKDIFKIKVKKRRRKIDLKRDMYVTQEWLAFIRRLPRNISIDKLKLLDKKLDFKGWGNAEIATEWYILGVEAGYENIRPNMEKFLKKVGRRKFLLPIYKTLAKRPADLKWAKDVYAEARANYHAVSQNTIDEILKFKPTPEKV
jgi:leukotriene-A4 hydrolase